jgi:8-oxo-dGTP pyrophosphatase MutT (NUDIX family)
MGVKSTTEIREREATNMAKIKSCGFLIYRNQPRRSILLMRHDDRWDLPKGHVDPGETNLDAAYRELQEETGITTTDIRLDEQFKFTEKYLVPGKRYGLEEPQKKKLIVYLAELIRPVEIIATEHLGYEWIEWSPPKFIQEKTIDPLLAELAKHWALPKNGI